MPVTYWKPESTSDIVMLCNAVMERWHKDLFDNKIKIGILFAMNSKHEQPAVKHAGHPANAVVKAVSLKDKISKEYDVEMIVDGNEWTGFNDRQRTALLDHELSHVMIKRKKVKKNNKKKRDDDYDDDDTDKADEEATEQDDIVYDDYGRPVVKIRRADWNIGDGFADVVRRHGEYSCEYQNIHSANVVVNDLCLIRTCDVATDEVAKTVEPAKPESTPTEAT